MDKGVYSGGATYLGKDGQVDVASDSHGHLGAAKPHAVEGGHGHWATHFVGELQFVADPIANGLVAD